MNASASLCLRYIAATSMCLLALSGLPALGGQGSEGEGHGHSRHHIEATFGAAYHDGKNGLFTGFEYAYRFDPHWGVGAFIDTTFSGFDLAAIGGVVSLHPADRWKVLAGLGAERKIGGDKDKMFFRVGAAYEFHVGNGTISPIVAYDFLEDAKDVVYAGVAIGFGF